jgi:medium-chain acyl-CoA synthetase
MDDRGAFSPIRLLQTIHKFPITTLCAPPTAYRQLVLDESQQYFKSNPPKCLEHCVGAGEPLNESVIKTWQKMSGLQIFDGYGQTETVLMCANQRKNPVKAGSMGKPLPSVPLVVLDAEGLEAEPQVEGDIAVRLDDLEGQDKDTFFGIFDGYIDMKTGKLDRRLQSFRDKGGRQRQPWYLTGDRATRDQDGYFWFVGRSDDVINSSGYRIGKSYDERIVYR